MKIKFLIALCFLSVIISSCATTNSECAIPLADDDSASTIVIYRAKSHFGLLVPTPFSIDGCRIDNLWNNSFSVYKLPEGFHRIEALRIPLASGGEGVVSGQFSAGNTYYLQYLMGRGSEYELPPESIGFTISPLFFITTKEHAIEVMPELDSLE